MSNNHILFMAGDPGGAAAILPVIREWRGAKTVLAYRHAATRFSSEGITLSKLDEVRSSTVEAAAWLEKIRPDCLCAATSVNGVDWERHFFLAAQSRGIPSLAVLDYWSNYSARFSLVKHLDALPDMIAVMDARASREMVQDGFPANKLRITGQPVLDEARRWRATLSADSRDNFRKQLGLMAETRAVLFVSQPLRAMNDRTGYEFQPWQDECASLERVARAIARSDAASESLLLIKLHPRESIDKYDSLIPTLPCPARIVASTHHRWEVCLAADVVIGIDSMLCEEAEAIGCEVERLQQNAPVGLAAASARPDRGGRNGLPLATELIAQIIENDLKQNNN